MQNLETRNPVLKKAHESLDEISRDSDARLAYDRRKSAIFFYEKTLEKKFSDGKLGGKIEGKREDAQNLLNLDIPLETVMKATGLSIEDLKSAGLLK